MPAPRRLSIVIPLRDDHPLLSRCLSALAVGQDDFEIIIATPVAETISKPRPGSVRVIEAPIGRGACICAGMREAKAPWILILHADTVLADGWWPKVRAFLESNEGRDVAGYFKFRHDSPSFKSRSVEVFVALRCMIFALPYGDQGLLISRSFYERIGGYRPDFPIMEDVDIVRRIGRGRLRRLDAVAVTSAERYARGYARRVVRNMRCLALYFGGVHPREIVNLYGRA